MAKKKAAPSVCELGGPEIQVMGIRIKPTDVVDFNAWSCGSSANITVDILDSAGTPTPLANQQGATHVGVTLPALVPGDYVLVWSFIQASTPWKTRVEVAVNGTDRFRHRKDSSTSATPFLRGFLLLQVVP